MKNIHVITTDKPSRLCLDDKDILYFAPINGFSIADGKDVLPHKRKYVKRSYKPHILPNRCYVLGGLSAGTKK